MRACANFTNHHLEVLLVVALPLEARPLINRYQLKKCHQLPAFSLYQSVDQTIALVVSGVGKVNAAMATAWAATQFAGVCAMLNVGIAGGDQQPIGSIWLANKVIDQDTGYVVYPMSTHAYSLSSTTLFTAPRPTVAPQQALIDMEASGFLQAASRFCSQEQAHCLKVVSDNHQQPHHQIESKQVSKRLGAALPEIDAMIEKLKVVNASLPQFSQEVAKCLAYIAEQHHTTAYQHHQLNIILTKLYSQQPKQTEYWLEQHLAQATSSKALLSTLQQYLAREACQL